MCFVQDDSTVLPQEKILLDLAEQNTVRHELQLRLRADRRGVVSV